MQPWHGTSWDGHEAHLARGQVAVHPWRCMRGSEMPGTRALGFGALAAIAGLSLAPVALLASTAQGVIVIAIATSAAAAAVAAIAFGSRTRSRFGARVAALAAGAAPSLVLAATSFLERALIAGPSEPAAMRAGPLVVAVGGALTGYLVAMLIELTHDVGFVRAMVPWTTGAAMTLALGAAILALLGPAAPTPEAALAATRPESVLAPMPHDVDRQTARAGSIELERRCDSSCSVRLTIAHEGGPAGATHAIGPTLGRGAVAIVRAGRSIVLAPLEGSQLRLRGAMALSSWTGRVISLRPSTLEVPTSAPRAWRTSAWLGLGIALACLTIAVATRRRRALVAAGVEGRADVEGRLRLPDGETLRAGHRLEAGPVLVLARERAAPSYRDDGVGRARTVLPGTREELLRGLDERVLACELAALAAIALTHAPLVAAWLLGRTV